MSNNDTSAKHQNPNLDKKLSEVADPARVYIPKSTYWHNVKDAEYGMSKSSNNPMFTLTVEIVDHPGYPDTKNPGMIVDPNGTEAQFWVSLTEKAQGNVKKFFNACGLPTDITINELLVKPDPSFLIGKKFFAIGYSKADPQIDEITKQPIKNPMTGEPVVFYQYKIGDVFPRQ